jgi:hypothetical protein
MSTTVTSHGRSDLPPLSTTTPAEEARTVFLNNVSWSAVLAGVAVALVTTLILNMLGLGIGVAKITPSASNNPDASTLSVAAGIWFVLSSLIAAFLGGHAAARLSGRAKASTAAWHGLIAWAVTTLVILYLLTTTVGGLIGGAFSAVTGATANQLNLGGSGTDAVKTSVIAAVKAAITGDQGQANQAQDNAAQALAKSQNISIDDARTKVNQAVDQAKQKAIQTADAAATVVSRGALFGFAALILGALAGWLGGLSGEVRPTLPETFADDRRARI